MISETVVARARSIPIEDVLAQRGINLKGKIERAGPCPVCGGTDRFSINTRDQVFNCRGCGKGGKGAIDLVIHIDGCDFAEAVERLTGERGETSGHSAEDAIRRMSARARGYDFNKAGRQHEPKQNRAHAKSESGFESQKQDGPKPFYVGHLIGKGYQHVATYPYTDVDGEPLLYQVLRYEHPDLPASHKEKKTFLQRRPDGNGGWYGDAGDRKVLYRWPDLKKYAHNSAFVCEGEKDADRLASLGFLAVTVANGKWSEEAIKALDGYECFVLQDNDDPGIMRAQDAAEALHGIAASVRVVLLPGLPEKGDVSDWLDAGSDPETLIDLCSACQKWEPPAEEEPQSAPGENQEGPEEPQTAVMLVRADAIVQEAIQWVWRNRLARGKLTLIGGDPGVGKSQVVLNMIARITTGTDWPDGSAAPLGNCVILSAEDAANDTLCPRLEAAGANLSRVHILQAVNEGHERKRSFNLQVDLDALAKAIKEIEGATLVMIDPITAYMGETDSHKTADVRAVLEAVDRFSETNKVAIAAITHPPKAAQAKAINAFTGSLAYVAAARLAFIAVEEMGEDGDATGRVLFLAVKNNIGAKADGIAYRIEPKITSKGISTCGIIWDSTPVTTTASDAINSAGKPRGKSAQQGAEEWLMEYLADQPMPAAKVREAAEAKFISDATLRRAARALGVLSEKAGFEVGWVWRLPTTGQN